MMSRSNTERIICPPKFRYYQNILFSIYTYSVGKGKINDTFPILQTSAKSAQTSAVVCTDYS